MLNSKQRAKLRGLANNMQPVFQIGKGGVTEEVCRAAAQAIEARELIKISVLETSDSTAREAADAVAEHTGSDVVSVIGRKFVLFKISEKPEKRKVSAELKLK